MYPVFGRQSTLYYQQPLIHIVLFFFECFQFIFWMKELTHAVIKCNKAPIEGTQEYLPALELQW